MKEILSINVGQAGLNIGEKIWQKLIIQHKIDQNGKKLSQEGLYNDHTVFHQTKDQKFVPRNIFVDTDPCSKDQLKKGRLRHLYNPSSFIHGKQDTSSNFIRGHNTLGREILDSTLDQVRRRVEACDNIQGIVVNTTLSGGTGSGFSTLLLSRLSDIQMLRKKPIIINLICPSPHFSDSIVQPYNTILGLGDLYALQQQKLINCFDNQKMYQICERNGIEQPSFNQINELTAQAANLLTHPFRQSPITHSLNELLYNMVPYRHLCFMQPNILTAKLYQTDNSRNFMENLWNDTNSLCSYGRKSLIHQKVCFSMSTILKGSLCSFDAVRSFQQYKQNLTWIQWCKTGFKLFSNPLGDAQNCNFVEGLNLTNNNNMLDMVRKWHQKYDSMYAKRVFVHWYVGEGMQDQDFSSQRENTRMLQTDYQQSSIILDYMAEDESEDEAD